jgi:cation diffusion facilitator family transporter
VSTAEARATRRAGAVAAGVGAIVVALKGWAALRADSAALLADAAESLVNLVVALIAVATVGQTERAAGAAPTPEQGRLEYLSAVIEGGLVVIVAFVVGFEAIARFGQEPRLPLLATGLGLSIAATAANAGLVRFLERAGRRLRSPLLLADAVHLRGDVGISLAVYAALGVAWWTGTWPIDAVVAIGVALHILIAGLRAVRHSVSGLLDEALSSEEIATIEQRLRDEGPPVVGFEDLRTRRSGAQAHIALRLLISRYALVYEAHEICHRLEADLALLVPGARVSIRVEPGAAPRAAAQGSGAA